MNIEWVKDVAKKYIIFTTLITIWVIAFLLWGTDENNIEVPKENTLETEQSRCIDIPEDLITDIESWLNIDWGWELINVKWVRSKDFDERYFVSWYLKWEWISENEIIATFTIDSLERGKTMIGSVNAFAKEFAVWPTLRIIDNSNDWIKQSQDCVKDL